MADLLAQAIDALRTLKAASGHGFDMWHRTYEPAIEKIEAVLKAADDVPNLRHLSKGDEGTEQLAAGVKEAWEVKVHCSKGERILRAGMKWRDCITGSMWEVVEPEGGRIYSPSGFGGTPTFWCRPVKKTKAAQPWLEDARTDGCVSFCGDSIAAQLIDANGVMVDAKEKP